MFNEAEEGKDVPKMEKGLFFKSREKEPRFGRKSRSNVKKIKTPLVKSDENWWKTSDVDYRDTESVGIFWAISSLLSVAGIVTAGILALFNVPHIALGLIIYLGVLGAFTFFTTKVLIS